MAWRLGTESSFRFNFSVFQVVALSGFLTTFLYAFFLRATIIRLPHFNLCVVNDVVAIDFQAGVGPEMSPQTRD